jgi:hypothetical protein
MFVERKEKVMIYMSVIAEISVCNEILKRDVIATRTLLERQTGFDIVVSFPSHKVIYVQVKSTKITKNNCQITHISSNYDILVIVVFKGINEQFFIMTKEEALQERGCGKTDGFSMCVIDGKKPKIKEHMLKYKGRWEKIVNRKCPIDFNSVLNKNT